MFILILDTADNLSLLMRFRRGFESAANPYLQKTAVTYTVQGAMLIYFPKLSLLAGK